MSPRDDPARRCLPVAEWPAPDRAAWLAATRRGDILDDPSRLAQLKPSTLAIYAKGYGRWLGFLRATGDLDADADPASRVTPDAVRRYLAWLGTQTASLTTSSLVMRLHCVARALAPATDWTWLARVSAALMRRAVPVRPKRPLLRPSSELFAEAPAEPHRACRRLQLLSSRINYQRRSPVSQPASTTRSRPAWRSTSPSSRLNALARSATAAFSASIPRHRRAPSVLGAEVSRPYGTPVQGHAGPNPRGPRAWGRRHHGARIA